MDIFKALQNLKAIEPEKDFTIKSRGLILGKKRGVVAVFWGVILKNIELGASVALAGLLIFMILGGFSAWKFFSPLQMSNLDPSGLKAEAQAIDIQIQLTNLSYEEGAALAPKISESTRVSASAPKETQPQTQTKISPAPNASSSLPVSIDEALQELSN